MRVALLLIGVMVLTPELARAQSNVEFNVGGGYAFTAGEAEDHLGNGGQFDAGITFLPAQTAGFQIQYSYTALAGRDINLPVIPIFGGVGVPERFSVNARMHSVMFDFVLRSPSDNPVSAYFTTGPGVHHRSVDVTTPSIGLVDVCDPFWYVCFPEAVPIDEVVGERSSTDFGFNFGGGVAFNVGGQARIYFDVRYIHVWGPEVGRDFPSATRPAVTRANGHFLPITVGLRW
jgi:hypothetical protein